MYFNFSKLLEENIIETQKIVVTATKIIFMALFTILR